MLIVVYVCMFNKDFIVYVYFLYLIIKLFEVYIL